MTSASDERMARVVEELRAAPGLVGGLPGDERAMVEAALAGESVHAIAQEQGISTEAVWTALGNAAKLASGQGATGRVEVGGLGSDTDPGVTGGYGDTGFGALDTEPPYPTPEEPREGAVATNEERQTRP